MGFHMAELSLAWLDLFSNFQLLKKLNKQIVFHVWFWNQSNEAEMYNTKTYGYPKISKLNHCEKHAIKEKRQPGWISIQI